MKTTNSFAERLVALTLSIFLILGIFPTSAFAVSPSVITTTLGDEKYSVGQTANFTVTTAGNEDADTMVLGSFEINKDGNPVNIAEVAKLEYQEYPSGIWYEFYGDFGPAGTGFPLQATATTSNFRVTFKTSGEYTVKVFVKTFEGGTELCAVKKTISVAKANPATIATTLSDQSYTVGQMRNFTVTTTGNEDADTMVLGSFEIKKDGNPVNIAEVAKLEYQEYPSGIWYEFYGDFGPAGTGFPLQATATTSNFRVTFKTSGEYTVKVFVKTFEGGTELCAVKKTISVAKANPATIATTLSDQSYTVGQMRNFTVTTTGNEDADTMVLGSFEIKKDGNPVNIAEVAKLEYQEYPSGIWYEFYGDFGPAGTGFPLQAATTTSNFRGTFKTSGEYTVRVFVKTFEGGKELCSVEKTIIVKSNQADFVFADKEPVISFNDDDQNKYKYEVQNAKGTVTYSIVSGGEIAVIDPDSGELTVSKPGAIVVKAVDTGDSLHNPAEATYTLTVNKDEQEIVFATPVPDDQWIGKAYMNTASGGAGTGSISYWLVDGSALVEEIANIAKINKETGELTFSCVGTQVKVRAVKVADDYYNETSATYSVTATKKEPTEVAFSTTGPITITYDPNNLSFENKVVGCSMNDKISWSVYSGSDVADLDTTTGILTIKKAGTIVIKATVAESPYYYEKSIEYTLVINPANQTDLDTSKIPNQITYSPDVQEGLIVGAGGSGTGAFGYEIVAGNEFAEIDTETGAIKILKAGNFIGSEFVPGTIKVKITKAGDNCYNAVEPVTVTISLARANQSEDGFGFASNNDTVTYNDVDKNGAGTGVANQYTLITSGGESSGDVTYQVTEGDAASERNGVLTISKSGTVKVLATKAADDKYNAISDEFVLTVEKADQRFTFLHTDPINEKYGLERFSTQINRCERNSGKMSYAVSGDAIGASVDGNGVVTFVNSINKAGTVTVTVTMVGDDCYNEFTDTYTITLSYEAAPATPYTLLGNKLISSSDWFTGDVTIIAPNGYQISYKNDLTGTTWGNSVIWDKDGETGSWGENDAPVVFLKNMETGAITDKISVSDLKRDTVKPNGLTISYDVSVLATIGEKIFGFDAATVKVTVAAADSLSGIGRMEFSLDGGKAYTEITATNGKYEFSVPSQYRGQLWIKATDVAGNPEEYMHLDNNTDKILVVDHTAPGLVVGYTGGMDDEATEGIRYVKSDKVTAVFTITDENFDLRAADPVVTVNDVPKTGWDYNATTGTLTFDLADEGDYKIAASFSDRLSREVTYASEVRVDRTKPVIDSTIENGKYYTANQTFVLTITEHNFDASKIDLAVSAMDSKNEPVLTDEECKKFADDAKIPTNWDHAAGTDVYNLELPIAKDGNYTVTVDCTDNLEWAADTYSRTFCLDKVNPNQPTLKYEVGTEKSDLLIATILKKLFGFAKETTVVTIQSGDATSGIDRLEYMLHDEDDFTAVSMDEDGKYTFSLEPQYRGKITVVVYDKAGRSTTTVEEKEIVVDNIAPKVEIAFAGDRQDAVKADTDSTISRETMTNLDDTTRFVYSGHVTATIKIEEANFFPENEDMSIQITCDGVAATDLAAAGITDSGWKLADGVYTRTFVMTEDGDYQVFAEYRDHSQNNMEWESKEYAQTGTYSYESNIHTVDTTAPVYEVTYDNNTVIQTVDGREYYGNGRIATIKVTDRNFRPDEVAFNVVYTDISGGKVNYNYSDLTDWSDWARDGITWTATVRFTADANYTVDFAYDDIANHKMVNTGKVEKAYRKQFTVDTTKPADLKVTYHSKDDQILNKILGAITFGNYKAKQEVVLTMTDVTAGIDYIKLSVMPDGSASANDLEMPEDLVINADGNVRSGSEGFIETIESADVNGNLTLRFDVPAQFRGAVSFEAYDRSGKWNTPDEDAGVLVVDTFAPGHTITYNPSNVVNASDMKNMTDFDAANGIVDITSTDSSYVMYFSGDAVATIKIDEANFDPAVVKIEVLDSKGVAVQGWTQTEWTTVSEAGKADSHTKTVTIPAEGDYQLKVYYQDHSMNAPVDYLSQWIVVDKTAPKVLGVTYSNTDVKNTIGGRDYFSAEQTATITIKEHNFRPDDVVIKVTAKDVLGADVLKLNANGTVKTYADDGVDRKNWTAYETGTWRVKDDIFAITLNFTADANYTFDIEYQDLARNNANDYKQDLFTVDTKEPENLTVDYSLSVFEQIKESIAFDYYNAMMTVEITATDDTSGIYHFAYSYIKGKDVSGVNAELLDQAIKEAEITYEGKKATATFRIPKMVLGNNNQFNGTVEFTAFDRSEISAERKDTKVIVVDNITPTSKITYNDPVRNVNGISYYNGNIDATITIDEANFDATDVAVSVTKNGSAFPVKVAWHDNSVDTHTGNFTLTEDGDYIVSVRYKDKSGNQMISYTSDKLTLDTEKPVIHVSNIKANSANKDKKYGFVITANDINLDVASIKPVLKAVKQTTAGTYEVVEIDLGKAATVVKGQAYTYTVENLPDDGLYTLVCEVKDMSNNSMSQIVLDDEKAYNQVRFSINRNGSAFGYGNTFTEELVGQYYIYSVDEDVVIVEVNVDPIEDYKVSVNGKDLVEGIDYTTTQTSKDGEWCKRTYTIKKELFEAEGEYSIIVSSTDKADTTAFSDVKNLSLAFVVDQTAPVLTITGLEAGGRYQTDVQTVTLIPTDEGGRLNSLSVVVLNSGGDPLKDESGNDISARLEMAGEDLLKYLEENDGKVTFTVPEGLNNQVKITCNDCAINAENLTNEYNELFENVTVSQNQLVIFYANKPLFYGTIGGVLAIIALIIILVKYKKNKKVQCQ